MRVTGNVDHWEHRVWRAGLYQAETRQSRCHAAYRTRTVNRRVGGNALDVRAGRLEGWKAGNLGSHADGRSVVLDWAYPGQAPLCWELVWYLALNRVRLPESKESTIERYREGLEYHGVATGEWWERQLGLSLIGVMATLGWEKAVGDAEELAWWDERVAIEKRMAHMSHA
ncbi:MAG: hypothetical protein ACSLFB_12170 [Acidimicrobiales bacterium]